MIIPSDGSTVDILIFYIKNNEQNIIKNQWI